MTLSRCPALVAKWGVSSGLLCPPIGLAYLASSLRKRGHEVTIVDPVGEAPFEVNPIPGRPLVTYGWTLEKTVAAMPADTRYVGLSCMFSQEWPLFKILARKVRQRFPQAVVIAGGEHVTAVPRFCLEDCTSLDVTVFSEGEDTIVDLVETLETGGNLASVTGICYRQDREILETSRRARIRDVDSVPWPAWDLVPIETYLRHGLHYGVSPGRTMPIVATRGCPFECTFCSSPNMWTTRWSARDPKDVADEIELYHRRYGASNFDFYDLTAIIRKDWIVAFCNELLRRELDVTWQIPAGTRSEAIDEEVAGLLARCGHRNLVYAPESGSPRILKIIKKKVHLPRMIDSMRSSVRNDISVKLNMICGFPDEDLRDGWHTLRFLAQSAWIGVDDVTFAVFSPYPGSELFDRLRREGKIPRLDEGYFYGLATREDARLVVSYCEKLGTRTLHAYKFFAYALFYSIAFLRRPQRLFQTLWRLYTGNHRTRIEKALDALLEKFRVLIRIRKTPILHRPGT